MTMKTATKSRKPKGDFVQPDVARAIEWISKLIGVLRK